MTVAGPATAIEWPGRGRSVGGFIVLMDEDKLLALYKPSWAIWVLDGTEFKVDKLSERASSLAVLTADGGTAALEHILLTCVAIEEQIRISRRRARFQ